MKLTVQQVFDATPILATIIREKRPLPQKGAYRLARMHGKLLPEYNTIAERHDALVMSYVDPKSKEAVPSVPAEKLPEFQAKWKEIAGEEIEVDVEPVPLEQLDLGDSVAGSIQATELVTLGDLVRE